MERPGAESIQDGLRAVELEGRRSVQVWNPSKTLPTDECSGQTLAARDFSSQSPVQIPSGSYECYLRAYLWSSSYKPDPLQYLPSMVGHAVLEIHVNPLSGAASG